MLHRALLLVLAVVLPPHWLEEDQGLAGDLPRKVQALSDSWRLEGPDRHLYHCYSFQTDADGAKQAMKALKARGGESRGHTFHVQGVGYFFWAFETSFNLCYEHPQKQRGERMKQHQARSALLGSYAPLVALLGEPERVDLERTDGATPSVQVFVPRAGVDLGAVGTWLARNGFRGDAAAGWIGSADARTRALVELGESPGGPVVVLMVVATESPPR